MALMLPTVVTLAITKTLPQGSKQSPSAQVQSESTLHERLAPAIAAWYWLDAVDWSSVHICASGAESASAASTLPESMTLSLGEAASLLRMRITSPPQANDTERASKAKRSMGARIPPKTRAVYSLEREEPPLLTETFFPFARRQ
jgi:hypothetical protein